MSWMTGLLPLLIRLMYQTESKKKLEYQKEMVLLRE